MQDAFFWQPPKPVGSDKRAKREDVQSAQECTGLMQRVPASESEAEAVGDLYAVRGIRPKHTPNLPTSGR